MCAFCTITLATGLLNVPAADAPDPAVVVKDEAPEFEDLGWLDLDQLSQIKVSTVSRKAVEAGKTAAAVHVITAEDIRRSGATSIPEALRLAPGVEVARVDSRRYSISIRGLNDEFANKLLALQDGRSLDTPVFGGVMWDLQDTFMEDIERIEIVRGPGGTAWGANAVNGVINIITKPAEDTQGTLVTAGGGSFERAFGGIRHGGELTESVWYRFYVKSFLRDETRALTTRGFSDEFSQTRGGFRIDSIPSDQTRITLQGAAFVQDADQSVLGLGGGAIDPTTTFGGHFLATFRTSIDELSDVTLKAYYDGTRFDGSGIVGSVDQFDIDSQYRRTLSETVELNVGLNYRLLQTATDRAPAFILFDPMQRDLNLFGIFADAEFQLIPDRLKFSAGIKAQYNDFGGWDPLPNARLLYTPDDRHTYWAAYSQGVSVPRISENDVGFMFPVSVAPPVTGTVNSSQDLDSEKMRAYEIGYRVRPQDSLSIDIAGYFNQYDDLTSREIIGFAMPFPGVFIPDTFTYANKLEGESYGVELSTVWSVNKSWRISGAYNAMQVDLRHDADSSNADTLATQESSPNHQLRITSGWDLNQDWELDSSVRYVDSIGPAGGAVDDYISVDLRLAWRPRKNWEIAVIGQNLVDSYHTESRSSQQSPPQGEIPRGVFGRVTASF
jgi:iron complex outermembrane recepter protein